MARVRRKMHKSILTIHKEIAKKEIQRMIKENDKKLKEEAKNEVSGTTEGKDDSTRKKEVQETQQEQSN